MRASIGSGKGSLEEKPPFVFRFEFYVLCFMFAVWSIAPFAFGQEGGNKLDRKAIDERSLACGSIFPSTSKQIMNEREIAVPHSSKVVHLWEAQQPDGSRATFYMIRNNEGKDAADCFAGGVRRADYTIPLRYTSFDPLQGVPSVDQSLQSAVGNELFLVQFWTVTLQEYREQIKSLGGRIYRSISENTYLVRMSAGAAERVDRYPYVRWVGEFHPAYKLDEAILKAYARGLEAVEGAQEGRGEFFTKHEYSIEVFERAGGGPEDVQPPEPDDDEIIPPKPEARISRDSEGLGQQAAVKEAIEAMGGSVNAVTPGGFRMQATLTMDQLIKVAHMNEVHFIQPWGYGGTD